MPGFEYREMIDVAHDDVDHAGLPDFQFGAGRAIHNVDEVAGHHTTPVAKNMKAQRAVLSSAIQLMRVITAPNTQQGNCQRRPVRRGT